MRESKVEDYGSGLAPVTEGWFVVNVRDAEWWSSETRGARCSFESEYGDPPIGFAQLGINVTVLEPGQRLLNHALSPRWIVGDLAKSECSSGGACPK